MADRQTSAYCPVQFQPPKAVCSIPRGVWSENSDTSETIYVDVSAYMTDEREPYPPQAIPMETHPGAAETRERFPLRYSPQVSGGQQYAMMAQGFMAGSFYEAEHEAIRHPAHSEGARGQGEGVFPKEMMYVCSPSGGCLPSAGGKAPSYVHVPPGYGHPPGGAIVCPPPPGTTTPLPATSTYSPWLYQCQTTAPLSVYGYAPSVPCRGTPPRTVYPVMYPRPMFFRYVPTAVSPRNGNPETRMTDGRSGDQILFEDTQPSQTFTSSPPVAANANDSRQARQRQEKGTTRMCVDNGLGKSSTKNAATHARAPSAATTPTATDDGSPLPKAAYVHDRVLTDFKMNKAEPFTLQDTYGHLLAFCLDQSGSRFIQEQLAVCSRQEMNVVHEELAPHALTLMRDVFGNYIIQILLQNESKDHRQFLAEILKENTLSLTLHVYGCRVVQKALEVLEHDVRHSIVSKLDTHVARCIKDMNGNHVIQKAIREFELEEISFIVDAVHERVLAFSVHPYGCRVVQRILEQDSSTGLQAATREKIMRLIADNAGELSQDLYGNYVVQHVLRFAGKSLRKLVIETLMSAPVDYACHKYASNVLEEALASSDREDRKMMIRTIVSVPRRGDGGDSLNMLTTNRFGNYVVQKMLDVVDDDLKCLLLNCLGQRLKTLKRFKYGKHIAARVEKMTEQQLPAAVAAEESLSTR